MKTLIKITLLTIFPILFFAVITLAQDKKQSIISIGFGYAGNEFKFDPDEVAEYLNGLWLDVDGKIVSYGNFRVGGVFNFQRTFDVTMIDPTAYPKDPLPAVATTVATNFNVVRRDTDTYSFGPRLSYKAGPVEPFVTVLFGFRNPTDVATRHFVRRYQAGVDIGLGHFFVRPFFLEYEFMAGFAGPSTHKYGAGAGFRF